MYNDTSASVDLHAAIQNIGSQFFPLSVIANFGKTKSNERIISKVEGGENPTGILTLL